MITRQEYLKNSIGLHIFVTVSLILLVNIVICMVIEKKRLASGTTIDGRKVRSIIAARRTWTGMLIGFVITVVLAVGQFLFRFGYFSLYQEMGAIFLGLFGILIGMVCGIKWRPGHNIE